MSELVLDQKSDDLEEIYHALTQMARHIETMTNALTTVINQNTELLRCFSNNVDVLATTSPIQEITKAESFRIKLGKLIRQKRKYKGYSQAELGAIIGVGSKAISAYERGKSNITSPKLTTLAKVLQINKDELRYCYE